MAQQGHPAEGANNGSASLKGGWPPSRGLWLRMGAVVLFAAALAAADAILATRQGGQQATPGAAPVSTGTGDLPASAGPEPELPQKASDPAGIDPGESASWPAQAAGTGAPPASTDPRPRASSVLTSPTTIASSWSISPVAVPPADAPPAGPSALRLAQQAKELFGIDIILEGQDWGADDASQAGNIGAAISAMEVLPLSVTSSFVSGPGGPLALLSNAQGRTLNGWQPYGDSRRSFYTNSDQGPAGYRPASEIILAPGANRMTVAHELLHAYQFRDARPDEYVLTLLADEMRSFMAATGWRQTATECEVREAAHQPWETVNGLYAYEGRSLTYIDENGSVATIDPPTPLEAFAMAGAILYARPAAMPLPDWPEYWDWFRDNLA